MTYFSLIQFMIDVSVLKSLLTVGSSFFLYPSSCFFTLEMELKNQKWGIYLTFLLNWQLAFLLGLILFSLKDSLDNSRIASK